MQDELLEDMLFLNGSSVKGVGVVKQVQSSITRGYGLRIRYCTY